MLPEPGHETFGEAMDFADMTKLRFLKREPLGSPVNPKPKVVIVGVFFKRMGERFETETEGRRQRKTRTGMWEKTTSHRHLEAWPCRHLDFRLRVSKTAT